MARKAYESPILKEGFTPLTPGDDPTIVFGPSQGTSGYESPYRFVGIDQADLDMILLNCDDTELAEMDINGDYQITLAEFQAWYDTYQPW